MDHIVSYERGASVKDMIYYKSPAEKESDLRRWRGIRKEKDVNIILFFEDGTIFDTFLPGNKYFRHVHFKRFKRYKNTTVETMKAYFKCRFHLWAQIAQRNGIKNLFDLREGYDGTHDDQEDEALCL